MIRRVTILVLLLGLLATVGRPVAASAVEIGGLRVESVDASDHPRVTATVVAPRELEGTDLDARHFVVTENGRQRAAIVERVTAQTQQIVLAVDTSGSMRGAPLAAAKEAAHTFLQATPQGANVAVVAFAATPTVAQPFTADRHVLRSAIDGLQARGGTALYDGVVVGAGLFDGEARAPRALVVLSDGADTSSAASLERASAVAAKSLAGFYAVELVEPGERRPALSQLATATRGFVAAATQPEALDSIYRAFAVDVSNRYELRYSSGSFGGTKLAIQVNADGVQDATSTGVLLPPGPAWRRILASPAGLVAGAVAVFAALSMIVLAILGTRPSRRGHSGLRRYQATPGSAIGGLAGRASMLAESTLNQRGWSAALQRALEAAGLTLPPGEFLVIAAGAVLGATALGTLLSGLLFGLLLGAVAAFATRTFLTVKASRRRSQFADQLDDTLQLLAGSLRAGHSLLQALDAVAKEAEAPARDEFRQIVRETRIGRDLSAAMRDAADRMASEDFAWIVQAVAIHREVGGDLAGILDTAGDTIRERGQLRRQVKALSAEGRLSGIVLMIMPVGLVGFMSLTNPAYIGTLTSHPIGWAMTGLGATLMAVGGLWLRKLVRISL